MFSPLIVPLLNSISFSKYPPKKKISNHKKRVINKYTHRKRYNSISITNFKILTPWDYAIFLFLFSWIYVALASIKKHIYLLILTHLFLEKLKKKFFIQTLNLSMIVILKSCHVIIHLKIYILFVLKINCIAIFVILTHWNY